MSLQLPARLVSNEPSAGLLHAFRSGVLKDAFGPIEFTEVQPMHAAIELFFKVDESNRESLKNASLCLGDAAPLTLQELRSLPVHTKHTARIDLRQELFEAHAPSELSAKLQSPHNVAYVDALGTQVLSWVGQQAGIPTFPAYYGTWSGRSTKFMFDITEDYPDIVASTAYNDSKQNGKRFRILNEPTLDTDEDLDESMEFEEGDDDEQASSGWPDAESCHTSGSQDPEFADALSEPAGGGPDSILCELTNVPTQIIAMEKCEGTLYDLVAKQRIPYNSVEWLSWLWQLAFALHVAQEAVGFTHNDLHTNNVMWVRTPQTHMEYRWHGRVYRIPTFGRILKIIDFGRGIFTGLQVVGQRSPRVLMSDTYARHGEAEFMYNFGPLAIDPNGPHIPPNPSFDLCRLATSLMVIHPTRDAASDPAYALMSQWVLDDSGKSVLERADGHERYHGFDLYLAIARHVHGEVPATVLNAEQFHVFRM